MNPINLSILDFKQRHIKLTIDEEHSINLSILDFKLSAYQASYISEQL